MDAAAVYEQLLVDSEVRMLLGRLYGGIDLASSTQSKKKRGEGEMKYAVFGLVVLLGLFAVVSFSGRVANAGEEAQLRAVLSATDLDPGAFGHADFIQRPDRIRFSAEVENVTQVGTGKVRVIGTPTLVTEQRGKLILQSDEDPSPPGGPLAEGGVWWKLGERLLIRLENLDRGRFPGNESCETRVRVGPTDGSLALMDGVAELDIQNNVPFLESGAGAEVRIRCEFVDKEGQRQRHETQWKSTLVAVPPPSQIRQ